MLNRTKLVAVGLALIGAGIVVEANGSKSQDSKPFVETWGDLTQGKQNDAAGEKWTLFSQGGLTRYATFSENEKGVDISTLEKWGGVRYWWNKAISTSYGIQHIVARHSTDLIVAGVSSSGQLVVERWAIAPPTGSLSSRHPASTEAIGVPIPVVHTAVQVEGGGPFIAPGARQGFPIAERTMLFEGSEISTLKAVVFDPEGRYVLCQEKYSGNIFQISIVDGTYSEILTSANHPYLQSHELYGVIENGFGGRVFPIGTKLDAQFDGWMVLTDVENDGNLEAPQSMTFSEFESLFPDYENGGTWKTVQ